MEKKYKIIIIMIALHDLIMILLFNSFKVFYFFEMIRLEKISLTENKLICIGVRCKENFSCTTLGI